jgi:tetratricopeptide (TPR) repeat protein
VGHSAVQLGVVPLLLTWPSLAWFYVSHLLWPLGLSVLYDRLPVLHADWRHFWQPLLAVSVVFVAVVISLRREQRRLGVFAALLVLAPLAPALVLPALFPTDYAHDRYLYLPCLGFALLVGIVLQRIRRYPRARMVAALAIVIAFSVATSAQIVYWANDLLLFDRATKIAPGNLSAFNNLANALIDRGRTDQAVSIFRQILQADPNNWPALYNLGLYDFQNAHYAEAEDLLRRASAERADDSDALALFADTLNHEGKYAEAESAIRRALLLRPNKPGYRRVLAEALYGEGDCLQALDQIRAEVEAYPEEQEAVTLLRRWRCEHAEVEHRDR